MSLKNKRAREMGVENNECIVATTWDNKSVEKVKKWINTLPGCYIQLFAFIPSLVNGKTTVVLGPDGSKKGWNDAKGGEKLRNNFIKILNQFNHEDGSNPFDFVEVGYGEFGQKILRGNCTNHYSNDYYAE
jgi:hypothetical protein